MALWIGIHESEHLVYEGDIENARAVWPAPVITIATVVKEPDDLAQIPETN